MVCFEFNSYFVGKGVYINSSYANRYYNYLVKKEKYVEIENLINRGLLDLPHSSNKHYTSVKKSVLALKILISPRLPTEWS
ncbi:hypothetical protein [Cedratvirus kamchatka]|uniref:Uncharacterized protein n=1 Tax=Cedratvirus kamchatka TaxID=2716914 RepID=A0A6G8MXK7_9VIRU|nr:hypothetical protein [Cedratvirus kamchatka]